MVEREDLNLNVEVFNVERPLQQPLLLMSIALLLKPNRPRGTVWRMTVQWDK